MKKHLLISLFALAPTLAMAQESTLPADWKSWTKANSPLVKVGAIPDCSADVKSLPPIYQETVATYCSVKPGGPGKVSVLVRPSVFETYQKRQGGYADGINLLLHLEDMQLFFATEFKNGAPSYAVFKETGEAVKVDAGHPLSPETCMECHTGYSAYCVAGQCGTQQ